MNIQINCHLAKLRTFKRIYHEAHFEVITRTVKHSLSPTWKLLTMLKKKTIDFETYRLLFLEEIANNPEAIKRIRELREIGKDKLIFLVCYERDPKKCHRSIVKDIIEKKIRTFPEFL